LEIIKLIDSREAVKVGLIIFKYLLRLLHPFAPFLTFALYNKLYSESILFSKNDGKLLEKLIESLHRNNLETESKSLVLRRNMMIMGLFYGILGKLREFKNKYSLQKESLIIFLVLLPMKRVGENKEAYLTEDENYKEIE